MPWIGKSVASVRAKSLEDDGQLLRMDHADPHASDSRSAGSGRKSRR